MNPFWNFFSPLFLSIARTKQTYRKTSAPEKSVTRRFSCTVGKSSKFWAITLRGNETRVQYGKIGSAGTSAAPKVHESAAAAQAEIDKLVREKLKGGYLEEVVDDNDDDGDDDNDGDGGDDDDDEPKARSSSASAKRSRLNAKGKASTTAPTAAKYISIGYDDFEVENPFDDEGSDDNDGEFKNGRPILPKKVHKLLSIGDIVDFSPDDSEGGNCLFVGAGHVWLSGCHSNNREALTVPLAISSRFADAVAHYAQVMQDRSNCYYFLSSNDAWIRKQFADANAAADLNPDWIFEIEFQQHSSLAGVSIVSRAWAEFSRSRQDDDDDSGDVLASVDFRDRDDEAGTDPIDSASTWVPLLVNKMKAKK